MSELEPITRSEQYLNAAVDAAQGNEVGSLPEPITREEKYLDALVDALENGGGSSLPEVTSSDNGKVLKVVNGAWDKSDDTVVRFEIPNESLTALANATAQFVQLALQNQGQLVRYNTSANLPDVIDIATLMSEGKVVEFEFMNDIYRPIRYYINSSTQQCSIGTHIPIPFYTITAQMIAYGWCDMWASKSSIQIVGALSIVS